MKKYSLFVLAVGLVLVLPVSAVYRFVSPGSSTPGSGYLTWETAGHSIQTVLNTCSAGDVVYVDDGVYSENLAIPVDLTLESWCGDPAGCVIDAPDGLNPAILISGSSHSQTITVRGFTLIGGSEGVRIEGNEGDSTNLPVISGCIIDGYTGSSGIHGFDADFEIEFCTIVNCYNGMNMESCGGDSEIRCNIIAYNSNYGITQAGTPYYFPRNNCYWSNTNGHIYGFLVGRCDHWCIGQSGTLPGEDPMFEDYAGGDYHLQTGSPCIDFVNPDSDATCHPVYYDFNETTYDLGAYGGHGVSPTTPTYANRLPSPGATRVAQNTAIQITLADSTAGLDLSSLLIRLSYTGYEEFFDAADCTYTVCEAQGIPPDCGDWCLNFTLPGTAHSTFHDYAQVRVDISVDDQCPVPNHLNHYWFFRADDIHPPVMLDDHYPPDSGTNIPCYGPIVIGFTDSPATGLTGSGVNRNSLQLNLNGTLLPNSQFSWSGDRVTVFPEPRMIEDAPNVLTVSIRDNYSNQMPLETINFNTRTDGDDPFVPGISAPSPTPSPAPTMGPDPVPAPNAVGVNPVSHVSFSVQDYETQVDLTGLTVQITRGSDVFIFSYTGGSGQTQFQVQGSLYCRRITCPVPGTWGENQTIYVSAYGAQDSASPPNLMSPVSYSFQTGLYAVPAMSPSGIFLLLIGLGALIRWFNHRKRSI